MDIFHKLFGARKMQLYVTYTFEFEKNSKKGNGNGAQVIGITNKKHGVVYKSDDMHNTRVVIASSVRKSLKTEKYNKVKVVISNITKLPIKS